MLDFTKISAVIWIDMDLGEDRTKGPTGTFIPGWAAEVAIGDRIFGYCLANADRVFETFSSFFELTSVSKVILHVKRQKTEYQICKVRYNLECVCN